MFCVLVLDPVRPPRAVNLSGLESQTDTSPAMVDKSVTSVLIFGCYTGTVRAAPLSGKVAYCQPQLALSASRLDNRVPSFCGLESHLRA